ncbi:MAG: hypothetical protein H7237_06090, partial [Alkalinema sp. FL-bin-369]|nr:hypothetical protein [Leptolyngbyaceae cyanobacterium LF-bin-369]
MFADFDGCFFTAVVEAFDVQEVCDWGDDLWSVVDHRLASSDLNSASMMSIACCGSWTKVYFF